MDMQKEPTMELDAAMNRNGYVHPSPEHAVNHGEKSQKVLLSKIRSRPDVRAFQEAMINYIGNPEIWKWLMNRNHSVPLRREEIVKFMTEHYRRGNPHWRPFRQGMMITGIFIHPPFEQIERRLDEILERFFPATKATGDLDEKWHIMRATILHDELCMLHAFSENRFTEALAAYYLYLNGFVFMCRVVDYDFKPMQTEYNIEARLNATMLNFTRCFYDKDL
jgi:hypothetical protein